MFDIFTLFLGVLAGVGGVVLFIKRSVTISSWGEDYDSRGRRITVPRTFKLRGLGIGTAALGGLLVLVSGIYTQDTGEAVVLKGPGGNIVGTDTTAGFGVTAPWNRRIGFDVRNQKIEMFTVREDGKTTHGEDGAAIQAPVKEGTNVGVSVTIRFSIDPSCVRDLYRQYKSNDNLRQRALLPGLRDVVRVATADYSAFSVKQHRADLSGDINDLLTKRWQDLCITLDDINLGNLQLDKDTEGKLVEINAHQADVESARADLEAAEVHAQTVKVNAQASADADQITRCGATTRTETQEVAGEKTQVQVVVPVPIDKCQNRLNEQVLVNNYIEALRAIAANGNSMFIDSNINSILGLPNNPGH